MREDCRLCGSPTRLIADFGEHPISSRFPKADEPAPPLVPLVVRQCRKCDLVQLGHTVDGDEIWREGYGYASGVNETMRKHLADIVSDLDSIHVATALDIGCNDGTLLRSWWRPGVLRIGFDPTAKPARGMDIVADYFSARAYLRHKFPPADRVTSIAMFYDLDDPVQFARDVVSVLAPDGIWCLEVGYLGAIDCGVWDGLCHEHLAYYGLKQIKAIADRVGLTIVRVKLNNINGGSLQVWLSRRGVEWHLLDDLIKREQLFNFGDLERDVNFEAKLIRKCVQRDFAGKRVYALGASTKGNTILHLARLSKNDIVAAVDRNPDKVGRRLPGTGIPIISEEEARANPPDAFLVLPWHFKDQLLEREKDLRAKGVKFIIPLPTVHVC